MDLANEENLKLFNDKLSDNRDEYIFGPTIEDYFLLKKHR
jgi:hypothetical protein